MGGASASVRYRVEWRHRQMEIGGARLEVTRARAVDGADGVRRVAAAEAGAAVDREFMVTVLDGGTGAAPVCFRAEEIAAWDPRASALPVPAVDTWWPADVDLTAHRYRILAVVTDAFAEALTLRLVGRRRGRMLLSRFRDELLGA